MLYDNSSCPIGSVSWVDPPGGADRHGRSHGAPVLCVWGGWRELQSLCVSHFIQFFASAEQFGFCRACPACGGLGQSRLRSGSPRGELSAMSGVGAYTSLFLRLSLTLSSYEEIFQKNAACTSLKINPLG